MSELAEPLVTVQKLTGTFTRLSVFWDSLSFQEQLQARAPS